MRLRGFGFPPKMFFFPPKMFFFPRKMFLFYALCSLLFWKTIPISMGFFEGHLSLTSPVKCSFFTPRVVLPRSGFLKKRMSGFDFFRSNFLCLILPYVFIYSISLKYLPATIQNIYKREDLYHYKNNNHILCDNIVEIYSI